MGILSALFPSGKGAQRASLQASELAASGVDQGRQYLQQYEDFLRGISNPALQGLSEYYNMSGIPQSQDELIALAQSSPLYNAILGQRRGGEQAILRNASATGGLRSGATSANLSDYNMQLENQALLQAYQQQVGERDMRLQGLTGLANMPTFAPEIAGAYGNAAGIRGQGIVAGQQAREQARQNTFGNILGLGSMALTGFNAFGNNNPYMESYYGASPSGGGYGR